MGDYIIIGNSLFEERFHKYFFNRENMIEGHMNIFVLGGEEYKLSFGDGSNVTNCNNYIIPKCVIKNSLESSNYMLNYIQDKIDTISFGEIFTKISEYVKQLSELDKFVNNLDFVLVLTGYYLSKSVNIIIKSSDSALVNNVFQSLIINQIYEDTFSFLSSLSNSIVIEGRIDKNKDVKIDLNEKFVDKDYVYNGEYIEYFCSQIKHVNNKLFRVKSLKLSESSLEAVESILCGVVTCARIVINQDSVEIVPLKYKYKDLSSLLTTPSFYLFKLEDDNFILINWSPDQVGNTKVNKVLYSSLQVS
ncbi:hypothetical protein RS030_263675 [Cryptosporidium xiaoi]|uniref:Uncharacterized protein n=1 Tax=Cryptosporidium xiaoi TaxID=659607 RepID=A0AAV9XW41_9CRYT